MSLDSAADLLFRISADSTPAQADLAALRASMTAELAGMGAPLEQVGADFAGMGEAASNAARRSVSETTEARHAIRGLGEEIGVRMPRFVGSWLASLGPVAGVMSAAFVPIAVIGLVEVLAKIPAALAKGIDWLHEIGRAHV